MAENLRNSLKQPLELAELNLLITLSIGVAVYSPDSNENVVELMKNADMALYDVKARGRDGVSLFQIGGFE